MDLQTLRIEHAVFLGFYAILTFANTRLHRGARGVRWFPVYSLCVFTGAVLVAMRGSLPYAVSVIFGDVFYSLGYVFLSRSLTGFFGVRSMRWPLQVLCVLVVLVGTLRYGIIAPDPKKWTMVFTLILTAQLVVAASLAFHNARGALRVSSAWMGVVLSLLSLSDFSRFLGETLTGPVAKYLTPNRLLELSLLDNSVLQGAVTVAFLWMTAAALRHDISTEASTDSLTGLLNRRAIVLAAEREIAQGRQNVEQMSAILLDLDRFKELNDVMGHQGGDAAIVAASRRLEEGVRTGDLLARLGGDEFVVLLPKTGLEEAARIAEKMRAAFEAAPIVFGGAEKVMTGSFGVAQVQGSNEGWRSLMLACDKALYRAKSEGGNCVSTG